MKWESKMPQNTNSTVNYVCARSNSNEDSKRNDTDLIEICKIMYRHKSYILILAAFFMVMSVIYSFVMPPVYKAEVFFFPPALSDVQMLDGAWFEGIKRKDDEKTERIDDVVYEVFNRNLNSKSLRRSFFEENNIAEQIRSQTYAGYSDEKILQEFSNIILAKRNKKNKDNSSLSVEWRDPVVAAEWANGFSSLAERETANYFAMNVKKVVGSQIRDIEYEIASKRKFAQQRREDKIAVLEEAASIAKSLDIHKESSNYENLKTEDSTGKQNQLSTSNSLYYKGYKALLVEADILRKRKSDDAFIDDLRDLQEQLDRLRSISINKDELRTVKVDQRAYPPEHRIKPKRKIIVIFGTLLGLLVGVLAALLINTIQFYRNSEAEKT